MSISLINVHNLAKSFAGRALFANVSFGIHQNERIGLVGPNGAGKSTLLKILAGQLDADDGSIARKKGLKIGFVEQTPTFKPAATVLSALLEGAHDPHEGLAQAYAVMAHTGLNQFPEDHPVETLSGGWKKRVAFAREFMREPDLLFLDEPTNHLDVSGIFWLEDYLKSAKFAFITVTHDRLFLARVVDRILDLDPRNANSLLSINGSYADYLEAKELEMAAQQRHEWVQKNKLRREKEWLARGSIARQTKQSARKEAAADLAESVAELKDRNRSRGVDINFGAADHNPKKLIEAKGIGKSYGDKVLFEKLDLLITPQTRLALLGDNGSGKSTLIKVLLGEETPTRGTISRADSLKVSYFEQNRETLNPKLSVLKNICPEGDFVFCQGQHVHVRSYLDRFLFQGIKAELEVGKLSGGEQARLRLAQLMLNPAQVLVLDEPTNDLDVETLAILEDSLREFNGAVLLVTHDRYFMDAVADQILAFPPTPDHPAVLQKFSGYYQWEGWYRQEIAGTKVKPNAKADTTAQNKPSGGGKGKLSFKDKFELENMEKTILDLEARLADLMGQSEQPAVLADHKKSAELHTQIAELQAQIENKYQRWSELESKTGD